MTVPAEMLTVAEARAAVLDRFSSLQPETVALLDALDRVLAERIEADIDLPPFANSATCASPSAISRLVAISPASGRLARPDTRCSFFSGVV